MYVVHYSHLSLFYLMIAFYVTTNRLERERYGLFLLFSSVGRPWKMDGIKVLSPSEISGSFLICSTYPHHMSFIGLKYIGQNSNFEDGKRIHYYFGLCKWMKQFLALDA